MKLRLHMTIVRVPKEKQTTLAHHLTIPERFKQASIEHLSTNRRWWVSNQQYKSTQNHAVHTYNSGPLHDCVSSDPTIFIPSSIHILCYLVWVITQQSSCRYYNNEPGKVPNIQTRTYLFEAQFFWMWMEFNNPSIRT